MIDVLDRISYYRNKRGWTEYQLSVKSGLTQSTISSWYRKNLIPSIPSLEKICAAFGITLSQFFASEDDTFTLTDTQRKLLENISQLSEEQQNALIYFLETL
ncbi:helix-turn-helix domain-containing protein [Lachnoclostridium sp. An138]|uniref:helix-turn-helix domain-containing protein n=1 Tax=Lachnoclostridium sp. An138 TaxID=1965560 RepID=UPI000B3AF28F|nr:helix-turn-helix transcriptional regulator [Lachnoclostridium sp. An138]OUQ16556.1 transcriptional regulator [Lachnoclostridium sp. An138]